MKIIPGQVEHHSAARQKLFGFRTESCSPSSRKRVRNQPGTLFAFTPESRSPSPGFHTQSQSNPARSDILNAFIGEVAAQSGKHITNVAPQVLIEDAKSLLAE
jgi:hypothetical protein